MYKSKRTLNNFHLTQSKNSKHFYFLKRLKKILTCWGWKWKARSGEAHGAAGSRADSRKILLPAKHHEAEPRGLVTDSP
jgi:hypothetical protein